MLDEQAPGVEGDGGGRTPALRGRRGWLAIAVAGVALLAVVASFGAITQGRFGGAGLANVGQGYDLSAAAPAPKGWQVYHDPLGLFSVRIPPNWKATGRVDGTYQAGSPKGSFSGKTEEVSIGDPSLGDASASIGISTMELNSPEARAAYCNGGWGDHETTIFNGYRADEINPRTTWLFESYNAHFQIDVEIPGVLESPHTSPLILTPPPTPTPLPQAMVSADRTIIATALASFKPVAKPLTCS